MVSSSRRDFTLDRWLSWFETLHPKKIDMTLDRLYTVLDRLKVKPPPYKVITVAGTNGKGSCVAILESIYWHAGYDVGTFTSPHLWRFNERIRLNGADAPDADLVELFREIDSALDSITLSYFESSAVAAFLYFAHRKVDVAILEVGMGGRLDATNTLDADCALIVSIDLDHREFLGDTREAIGREKAGIMRPGKPVVIADRAIPQSVLDHAAVVGAVPYVLGRDFDLRRSGAGWCRSRDPDTAPPLPVPSFGGDEQFANAAACAAVVEQMAASLPVGDAALAAGIERAYLRGRFERHRIDGVEWVFDVGHNPAAAERLCASLQQVPVAGRTFVVFAAMRDKDVAGVVRPFVPLTERWFVTQGNADRGATAAELAALVRSVGAPRVSAAPTVADACALARAAARPGDRVLVFGSFVTVGAATEALRLYCASSPLVDRPATWTRV
ncbi:MAG TPA: folylpolyglutamate synthase/dihydrofolate synthase family protein [Gammaproteobacteria bacterium]|nr:folylpolyglutamate synthase/dihydrofolate synthase family protein [Gammaproteobacteria bacterium]